MDKIKETEEFQNAATSVAKSGTHNDEINDINKLRNQIQTIKSNMIFWSIVYFAVLAFIIVIHIVYIANIGGRISEIVDAVKESTNVEIALKGNNLLSPDYLLTVIPILISLAGSLLAFLGMNRLKMFDERIDRNRVDILTEINEKVNNAVALAHENQSKTILEQVDIRENNHSDEISSLLEDCKAIKSDLENMKTEISNTVTASKLELSSIVQRSLSNFDDKEKSFADRYEWLKKTMTEENIDLNFSTVSEAEKLIISLLHSAQRDKRLIISSIVERVVSSSKINGSATDYHNLGAELARHHLYNEACTVLYKGLSYFDKDIDLLADLTNYASQVSEKKAADEAVKKLYGIDKILWNWRAYTFLIEYYSSAGDLNKAYELSDEFIENYPNDEHGYSAKALLEQQLFKGKEGITKAINTLTEAINNNVNCPQCANALTEIMLSIGNYDEAIKYSTKALMELAQEQPGTNISYVFFSRATAYDRKFMADLIGGNVESENAKKAIADYQLALDFSRLNDVSENQAQVRMKLLSQYIQDDESIPLDEFISFFSRNNQNTKDNDTIALDLEAEDE